MSEPLATDLAGFEPYLEKITPPRTNKPWLIY